jgi:hypothetical protein
MPATLGLGELLQQLFGPSSANTPSGSDLGAWAPPAYARGSFDAESQAMQGPPRDDELMKLLALQKLLGQHGVPLGESQSPAQRYGRPQAQSPLDNLPPQLRALLGMY